MADVLCCDSFFMSKPFSAMWEEEAGGVSKGSEPPSWIWRAHCTAGFCPSLHLKKNRFYQEHKQVLQLSRIGEPFEEPLLVPYRKKQTLWVPCRTLYSRKGSTWNQASSNCSPKGTAKEPFLSLTRSHQIERINRFSKPSIGCFPADLGLEPALSRLSRTRMEDNWS